MNKYRSCGRESSTFLEPVPAWVDSWAAWFAKRKDAGIAGPRPTPTRVVENAACLDQRTVGLMCHAFRLLGGIDAHEKAGTPTPRFTPRQRAYDSPCRKSKHMGDAPAEARAPFPRFAALRRCGCRSFLSRAQSQKWLNCSACLFYMSSFSACRSEPTPRSRNGTANVFTSRQAHQVYHAHWVLGYPTCFLGRTGFQPVTDMEMTGKDAGPTRDFPGPRSGTALK